MNNSSDTSSIYIDHGDLVQTLNDKMAHLHLLAIVYIVILMLLGLVGNSMVCYYYGVKARKSTNSLFIVILSVYDLIVCAVSMPTEVADIVLYYQFESNIACKLLRFVNYFAAIGSILTLIAIATDRFKKICHPTRPQMSIYKAKIVSAVIILLAIFFSWPSLAIYGSIKVNIPNDYDIELKGSDCTSTKDQKYRKFVWVFNGVHFLLFFVLSSALIILYSIIGRKLFTHSKRLQKFMRPAKSGGQASSSSTTETSFSNVSLKATRTSGNNAATGCKTGDGKLGEAPTTGTGNVTDNTAGRTSVVAKEAAKPKMSTSSVVSKPQQKTGSGIDKETVKITIVMIIVSIVFIISFLPYLSLTIWRISTGKHEAEFLSGSALVAFKIGSRSFLLNSSLNPWIYGIFNTSFRAFFFGPLCRLCKKPH